MSEAATGTASAPTPKMLEYARKIATAMERKLPESIAGSFDECKVFIDDNKAILDIPTEKQLNFAKTIADKAGVVLPEELLNDRRGLSAWIDANKPL
jgi:hypothetical protein